MKKEKALIPYETIEQKIYLIRGKKIMLDMDLALLYGVETKAMNRAVKRNMDRFPMDFMFQLNAQEFENLRYQFGTSSYGGRRYLPYVFTEQGVAMLSGILNSKRAIEVNVQIIRTFVKLREMIISNKELRIKMEDMERKYDKRFKVVFDTLRSLIENNKKEILIEKKEAIGFKNRKK
ncbi:MAG TPA: DNA-binding protein [Candidatus Moranbacteria bacterium]|nr:DNA-binding protein [Candidatus Moranbacteria bacterium]HBT45600.1 DNA-binding protein [Candidatus Moranbacteria bacterium]